MKRILNRCVKSQILMLGVGLSNACLAYDNDGSWQEGFFYHIGGGSGYFDYTASPIKTQTMDKWIELTGRRNCYISQGSLFDTSSSTRLACDGAAPYIIRLSCRGSDYTKWYCSEKPEPDPVISRSLGNPEQCPSNASASIGNPITISNGNKFQQELVLSGPLPLYLTYNSIDQQWRHNFAYKLIIRTDKVSIVRPDGRGYQFTKLNDKWIPDSTDHFYSLTESGTGTGFRYTLVSQQGVEDVYNYRGQIQKRIQLDGRVIVFKHTGSSIEIIDQHANSLQLDLDGRDRITLATLNGVEQTTLVYDDERRLLSRTDALQNTTTYHYENSTFPNHLTGITGPDGQRFATWAYDYQGRAISSEHAGQEEATLLFNADGSTTVTNSLGKQTTYHYQEIQGVKRPLRVQGHASGNCITANKEYTYYDNGLLETQTDWSGDITRFEYNDRGLMTRKVVAEGTADEQITEQQWHASLPLLLEVNKAGVVTRYQYNAQNRLIGTEEQVAESN